MKKLIAGLKKKGTILGIAIALVGGIAIQSYNAITRLQEEVRVAEQVADSLRLRLDFAQTRLLDERRSIQEAILRVDSVIHEREGIAQASTEELFDLMEDMEMKADLLGLIIYELAKKE